MANLRRTQKALRLAIAPILGVWSDLSIQTVYGIPVSTVRRWRAEAGKPPSEDSPRNGPKSKGAALRAAVLDALWTRQPSTSGEVHDRVVNNLGTVTQRQVVRVLQAHVATGRAIKELNLNGIPVYRKTC